MAHNATKRLYMQPIPAGAQLEDRDDIRSNLVRQGVLGGGGASDQITQQPGDHILRGQYRCRSGDFAELMVRELKELGDSSGFDAIPFYRVEGGSGDSGYYAVQGVEQLGPVRPQELAIQQFSLRLSKDGTRKTRWRAIVTHPTEPDPGHDFGIEATARVGIPRDARNVRAIDAAIGPSERVIPTVDESVNAEYDRIEIYDALDLPFDDPIFIYDLDYDDIGRLDPVVWDTLGHDEKFLQMGIGEDIRQWQHVFDPAHDPVGEIVLDNGLLRLRCDDDAGTIAAEEIEPSYYGQTAYGASPHGRSGWASVGLDAGDWSLVDVDLMHISPIRAEAQLEFEDTTDGSLYAVDVQLDRGLSDLRVWTPPTVSDPIPSGLADLFESIASESTYDPGIRQTLISRKEVRR